MSLHFLSHRVYGQLLYSPAVFRISRSILSEKAASSSFVRLCGPLRWFLLIIIRIPSSDDTMSLLLSLLALYQQSFFSATNILECISRYLSGCCSIFCSFSLPVSYFSFIMSMNKDTLVYCHSFMRVMALKLEKVRES